MQPCSPLSRVKSRTGDGKAVDKIFLDTDIIVYANDIRDTEKQNDPSDIGGVV